MKKSLFLGIELGSTRIKSVLIDESFKPVAVGNHNWENRLENGVWTYHLSEIWSGLQAAYADLAASFQKKYGEPLTAISGIGLSAMMHGYIPMDNKDNVLTEFRTWRNTSTGEAATILRESFGHNIPLRWSVAHLYQAILNGENHAKNVDFITTLSGYVHYKLTGKKVLGIGDASGMFPIDSEKGSYNASMVGIFDSLVLEKAFDWKLMDIMPKVLVAGENAGQLTEEGAKLLDPSGVLKPGIPFCPPEGDAGTGMVATHSVAARTGNVSSGTSIFAMVVLEKALSKVYPELDIVTTPDGKPVAMVHCNNGTSDLDGWVQMFSEILSAHTGQKIEPGNLYETLYKAALEGSPDGGGLMACNYLSGEHNTGFDEGRPLFMRLPNSSFTMANFMRTMLMSVMATLKLGMDILAKEGVTLTQLMGHGGFFKTEGVGQRLMAGALNVPVAVMDNAGEGGAWGIALLASYLDNNKVTLDAFLNDQVFANFPSTGIKPRSEDVKGFAAFMKRYKACLAVERTAVDNFSK
ncbi:MAG: FGGY-family carbohydrate kinase [Defluviitaleaceae bacterium]|nr:FGGY-family carbohydrate kinase [Defluviitaleaceae bacterium]